MVPLLVGLPFEGKAQLVTTYDYTGALQTYTVPPGVTKLRMEAMGAQGKAAQEGFVGGKGAYMSGDFNVTPGDVYLILVGEAGKATGPSSGGGGGGTFIVKVDPTSSSVIASGPHAGKKVSPVLVAGGGGGTRQAVTANGFPGVTTQYGTTGSGSSESGAGGGIVKTTGLGLGGIVSSGSWGSGGGGWNGDGAPDSGTGGASFLNGAKGATGPCGAADIIGGYGGGGGGGCHGGGGGGGYSGGDGGRVAGGGGSYNIGLDQRNVAGANAGNGKVIITILAAGSLNFDGIDDFVELGNSHNNLKSVTFSAWIYKTGDNNTGFDEIWAKEYISSVSVNNVTNKLHVNFGNGTSWGSATESSQEIPLNQWVFVAATRDIVTGAVRLYVNGELAGTGTNVATGSNTNLRGIGHKPGVPFANGAFAGTIEEVRVWDRVLCEGEIKTSMNAELPLPQAGLVSYYKFNQGILGTDNSAVATLLDEVGGVNGTLKNFALLGASSNWVDGYVSGTAPAFVAPTVSFTTNQPLVQCSGGSVTFAATAAAGSTYQWTRNGAPIAGATNSTYTATTTGSYTVIVTQTGCTATAEPKVVVIEDTTPPVVPTLADVIAACSATVPVPTTTDACAGTIEGTTTDALTYTTQGEHTITWTFHDGNGNSVTAQQKVIIKDEVAPVLAVPFNITVNADANACGAKVTYNAPSATDNCGEGTYPTTLAGHTFKGEFGGHAYFLSDEVATPEEAHARAIALGGHLVTINSAQENTFISSLSPDRIWIGFTDRAEEGTFKWVTNEPVVYTNWNTGEPNNFNNEDWAVMNWGPNGTWNDWFYTGEARYVIEFEGGAVPSTLVAGLGSGATFPIGTTTETWKAVDKAGNVTTGSFTVTVVDNVPPVVVTQDIKVQLDANGVASITPAQINNGSTDNCAIPADGFRLSKTSFNCSNVGANTVTLTVTDANGNSQSKTAVVTVEDTIVPVAKAKALTVKLDANGVASITPQMVDNGSSDNCGGVTLALSRSTFDCITTGPQTVTLTVTDNSGNTASATATITVVDEIAPKALARNLTVQLDATGKVTIAAADVNNNSTDNCAIASVTLNKTTFTCANVGANPVTLTVTDNSGNVSTATATVTVEDKVKPVVLAKNITVQLNASGTATITATDVDNGSSDNCGIQSITLSKTAFDCANLGENSVTLTVTDVHGNTATAPATVTVEDKINPTITAPVTVTVNVDPGQATASSVTLGTPVTADNCSVASVTNNAPATYPTGTTTVTWTVTDAAGNTATATQIVTVRPNVVSVARPSTVEVPIRTTFAQVSKPITVNVTFTDGTTAPVAVTWQAGNYNGLVNGDYELTGTLTIGTDKSNVDNVEAKWTVRVLPNQAPTNITLSKATFQPSIKPDQSIGSFTTTDADDPIDNQPENQHLYELVAGAGSTDNALFEIDGNQLFLKSNKGLSGKTSFSIRVRTVDPYNNTFEKTFTLTKEGYNVATVDLKIVNAFSPNGDGVNDTWTVPELRFYNNVEVQVFDRSGVRLFHTTNPEQGWNGRNQHGAVQAGPYLYIIHVKDINYVKRGTVTILKK